MEMDNGGVFSQYLRTFQNLTQKEREGVNSKSRITPNCVIPHFKHLHLRNNTLCCLDSFKSSLSNEVASQSKVMV